MESIIHFFKDFLQYCINAKSSLGYCILVPLAALAAIWFFTFVAVRIFDRKEKFTTVFMIHRYLVIISTFVAAALISIICYCWSKNIFAENKAELAYIIALFITFFIPIVSLAMLRSYWSKQKLNNIIGQPVSPDRARKNIRVVNKAFNRIKRFFLLPFVGFLFLLFALNSGKNLISIVFDNSPSMDFNAAVNALSLTFDKLNENNEIIFTNLNNKTADADSPKSFRDILSTNQSQRIRVGANYAYNNPKEAGQNFKSTLQVAEGSPICEVIWKMWLFTKETKANNKYKNKLLIIITDGDENWVELNSLLQSAQFFYENVEFAEFYTPENTHIVDYSPNGNGIVIKKFEDNGAVVYPAVSSTNDYLDALDDALLTFQSSIFLIVWTIAICVLFTLIGLCITPKKIAV